jgi:hypothetical protein
VAWRRRQSGWRRRLAIGVAASVGIGVAGVAAEKLVGSGASTIPQMLQVFDAVGAVHMAKGTDERVAEADRDPNAMANALGNRLNSTWANNDPSSNGIRGREAKSPPPAPPHAVNLGQIDAYSKAPADSRKDGESAPVDWRVGTPFPTYRYNGPVGLNTQVPGKWEDYTPRNSALSISQGIPDAQTMGFSNYVANNDQLYLGVDESVTGGGPRNGANKTTNSEYSNILARVREANTGSLIFGAGVNTNAGLVGSIALEDRQNSAGRDLGGRGRNTGNSVPAQSNGTNAAKGNTQANTTNTGNSLGYINPSDLKPALAAAEPQRGGGIASGEALGGRETKGTSRLASQEPPPPAPAEQALPANKPATTTDAGPRKIVIRSGDMEFEVESFDSAVATVTKLVIGTPGAYVATVNSDKLPNGRVKGSIALRVPPERLDSLVLDLRKELGKGGELKGQRIGSQDITKQYTDLESRLRAARTMEARLLQMIKEGKGEIKQLLEAERELGTWRTKIEECEGELRYFGNLVALSTLTITLEEKGISAAAAITECERVQSGIEVEDVDKALQASLAAVAEANGRVTKSELKQLAAGQFNATLHCELAPSAAGPFRDRLSQQGRVARLEIDRVQTNEGGTVARNAKVTRGDTQFLIQFYNLANVAPRETRTLLIAVSDVAAGYQSLREAIAKTRGRVLTSRLDEQDRQNVTAQLDFEVRRADEAALSATLAGAGEVVSRNAARATDGENLTDAKVLFRTALVSAGRLRPRETTTLAVEVPDVDAAIAVLKAQVGETGGRSIDAQAAHERAGRVTARLIYDVPLSAFSSLVEKAKAAGIVRVQQSAQDQQAPDGKLATARLDVTLSNTDLIVAKDDGLWPQVRRGLSLSALVLLTSVTWVVFGLCVVLPWAVVGYGVYRVFRWLLPKGAAAPPAPATTT